MDEAIVFGVLILALVLFVTNKWRYDVVALLALLVLAIAGIVPPSEAFRGFGHPAVVTVAAVLILSRALYISGVVDVIANWYSRIPNYLTLRIVSLSAITAFLFGVHEQRRRGEPPHAGCHQGFKQEQAASFTIPNAAGFRIAPRRPDNAHRDPTKHHHLEHSPGGSRGFRSTCSTSLPWGWPSPPPE